MFNFNNIFSKLPDIGLTTKYYPCKVWPTYRILQTSEANNRTIKDEFGGREADCLNGLQQLEVCQMVQESTNSAFFAASYDGVDVPQCYKRSAFYTMDRSTTTL
jgi:hypothetical protein